MRLLTDAFEYNAWATRQLGQVCRELSPAQLTGREEWQYQPILDIWRHIDQVERAYLRLMDVAEFAEPANELQAYLESTDASRKAFVQFAQDAGDEELERMFNVPWFERDFRVSDGLFQVLSHSIEHRADIAHFLSRMGHETPPIDYVIWIYLRDGGKVPQA